MSTSTLRTQPPQLAHFGRECLAQRTPAIQLLTNGRLTTMLAATGAGHVQLGGRSVTRWRAIPTGDRLGYLFYLRDLETQAVWSLGYYPTCREPDDYALRLTPGGAEIERVDGDLATRLEVCVDPDRDFDLRRVTITNRGATPRAIEITSYAEIVLQDAAADAAHPAFSNLFVQTGWTDAGLLHARRRPRRDGETTLSACQLLAHDGSAVQPVQFETDRRAFVGRGRSLRNPRAMEGTQALGGSVGGVLDPVFAMRTVLLAPPGGSASAVFALGAGESHDQLLSDAAAYSKKLDFDEASRRAEDAAREQLESLAAAPRQVAALLTQAAERLYGRHELPLAEVRDEPLARFLARYHVADRSTTPWHPAAGESSRSRSDRAGRPAAQPARPADVTPAALPIKEPLQFANGLGGFTSDGREYVLQLEPGADGNLALPPLPWNNVIANRDGGFIVSDTGSGYVWSANSRLNRLTPWFNDSVVDPHGEAAYLRDEATGEFWSLTPGPAPHGGRYEVRHGWGYTTFRHTHQQLEQEVTQFVPCAGSVKVSRIRVTNRGNEPRSLALATFVDWELGEDRPLGRLATHTEIDADRRVCLAANADRGEFSERVAFAAIASDVAEVEITADRTEFVGLHGDLTAPRALVEGASLSGRNGAGLDPCAAFTAPFQLAPGETRQFAVLVGESASRAEALELIERHQPAAQLDAALADAQQFWRDTLTAVQITTPAPAIDLMVNGWLQYQNLSCRMFGRSSSYQSGGAYGFRDQLQDAASLVHHWPELTRNHVLLNAAHQFVEGDVLHWWHPPRSRGMRTTFSDDLLWLPLVASEYVEATGDESLWDEEVRFLAAPPVPPGEPEIYLTPEVSGERGTVFEHCCRALDRGLTRGANGLPLMGCGDWNDGMNRVGVDGAGESVWLGFFIDYILERFLPVCEQRGDRRRVEHYAAYREPLRTALNDAGWDGQWYRRAYFDDGTPLGTAAAGECRIDALVQAWAVLSDAAPPERAASALAAADARLVDPEAQIIRLLDPPCDRMPQDPGYIKGYVPGVRENGGQYTHGVLWLVRAMAELGHGSRACELLEMIAPPTHGRSADVMSTYKAEPYVIAADVYGQPPHAGRAGWSWYTGSAGWMFRVAVESILGVRLERGARLRIDPRIAASWPACRVEYRLDDRRTIYDIEIRNPRGRQRGVTAATLDGQPAEVGSAGAAIPIARDGRRHVVVVEM